MLGGGGVDGAIHNASGPELLEECGALNGCATGDAKMTKAYRLPCKWVIHTVGPVWQGGTAQEAELLRQCYLNCFKIMEENNIKSIAFPSISTGVYGFPIEQASKIALTATKDFLEKTSDSNNMIIKFICFSEYDLSVYNDALKIFFSHS